MIEQTTAEYKASSMFKQYINSLPLHFLFNPEVNELSCGCTDKKVIFHGNKNIKILVSENEKRSVE